MLLASWLQEVCFCSKDRKFYTSAVIPILAWSPPVIVVTPGVTTHYEKTVAAQICTPMFLHNRDVENWA